MNVPIPLNVDANSPSGTITAGTGQVNWADPTYDKAGNMTMLSNSNTTRYDAWNRLVAVYRPNYSTTNPYTHYEYDGLNRMVVRELDPNYDGTVTDADTRHYYYNSQWQVLVEATGTSTLTADVMYSYHPHYVDAIAHRMTDTDCHVYLADANYNVTAMLDATDRTSPSVVERYSYTPYGGVTVLKNDFSPDGDNKSDIGNTYLYTGRWRDPNTGLQLNRNRWFDSQLGRWLTRDPIGYRGMTFNLYEYVGGQPIVALDYLGLEWSDPPGGFSRPRPRLPRPGWGGNAGPPPMNTWGTYGPLVPKQAKV